MKCEVIWCRNGSKRIYGKLYLPDGEGRFPLVIFSHGYNDNRSIISMRSMAENGIAAYVFDFCGGAVNSKSDGVSTEMSVLTEIIDLESVLNQMLTKSYVDKSSVFLCGHSMGGYISTVVGVRYQNAIRGIILYAPALISVERYREDYFNGVAVPETFDFLHMTIGRKYVEDSDTIDIYSVIKKFRKKVYIFHGTYDRVIPVYSSEKAVHIFPDAELSLIKGANHMFKGFENELEEKLIEYIQMMIDVNDY